MTDRCTNPTCEQHWPAWVNIPEMRDQLAAAWADDPDLDPANLTDAEVIAHHGAEFHPMSDPQPRYTTKVGFRKPEPTPEPPDWLKGDGISAVFYRAVVAGTTQRNTTDE